jgi:hypothetical protein
LTARSLTTKPSSQAGGWLAGGAPNAIFAGDSDRRPGFLVILDQTDVGGEAILTSPSTFEGDNAAVVTGMLGCAEEGSGSPPC